MLLRIMSGENLPDEDSRKTFRLLDNVEAVDFERVHGSGKPSVTVAFTRGSSETFYPQGNCYLLSNAGKVLASFGVSPP